MTDEQRAEPTPDDDAPRPGCPACKRPASTWALCDHCLTQTSHRLGMLPELRAMAEAALLPSATGELGTIGGHREPPLPCDLDALDLAHGQSLLVGFDADDMGLEDWAIDWRHWLGHAPHGMATERDRGRAETITGIVRYLQANLPRMGRPAGAESLPGHPAIDEFVADVRGMYGRALRAAGVTAFDLDPDPQAQEPWDYVIPCPHDTDTGICGYRIGMRRQYRAIDDQPPVPVTINCPRCGSHWDTRRLLMVAIDSGVAVDMSLAQVMDYYGCTERTIRRKVALGLLTIHRGRYRVTSSDTPTNVG